MTIEERQKRRDEIFDEIRNLEMESVRLSMEIRDAIIQKGNLNLMQAVKDLRLAFPRLTAESVVIVELIRDAFRKETN